MRLHGKAIQRSGTQANTGKIRALVRKRIRNFDAQDKELQYFHLAVKMSLKLSHLSEFVSTDAEEHYHPQEIPQKLDFMFTSCKFQSQYLSFNVPGWTGFNTLLANDVPTVSKISFLPIIDNPITEMSTINEVVQIADELELLPVLLVADEAVYAKIQQV